MDYANNPFIVDEYRAGRHSGLGIVSFLIALAIVVIEFVLVVICGVVEVSTPGGMDENSPVAILLGLGIVGGLFAALISIGLGIAGLFQRDRSKLFAVLGMALSSLVVLGVLMLMVIGLTMA
jgi:hypothetical protein